MDLRLHPCSVAPAEGHEKCRPNRLTPAVSSCNNAKERGLEPAPERKKRTTWREFLAAHWDVLAAADCFTVELWTPRGLTRFTVLVLIHLASRRV